MTTIAYKDGVIACDSWSTRGDTITNRNAIKRYVRDGVAFFMAGCTADFESFFKLWRGEPADTDLKNLTVEALVVWNGDVYISSIDGDEFWRSKVESDTYAIGSGREFALGAMDMGATAAQAVKIACGRDTHTGGRVRSYRV